MPEPPVDLTEFARLRNISELLRQSGINYPRLSQAPPPQAFQDLMRAAPVAAPAVAGGGLGFLGMLAELLAQGGSSDPNAQRFYEQRAGQGPTTEQAEMPMGASKEAMRGGMLQPMRVPDWMLKPMPYARQLPIQEDLRPPSLTRRPH